MVDEPEEPNEAPPKTGEDSGIVRAVLSGGGGDDEGPIEDLGLGALARGTIVGHYVILSQLSGDLRDSVYAAFDTRTDRKLALKVVEVMGTDDDDARSRREEMIAAATRSGSIDHPGIVAVLDAGTVGSAVYVAMEFIDGIDLRQWMEARDDPFPWPEVLRVFREAGAGLAAAHAAGCVHGDFTPSRAFMEKSGRICVFDFGLATPDEEVSRPHLTMQSLKEGLTISRSDDEDSVVHRLPQPALVGTPRYLAPELHAGVEPDAKADQFAFCAAMYEALYGEVPFKGESAETIANEALGHAVRPAPPESDVPQWLRAVLLKGLSPRRRDRFSSMEVLLRQLEHDPRGRRRRWVVGMGVLTLAAAAVGGIAYLLEREAERCEADAELLAGTWDSSTRASLEDAFLGSGHPEAAETWELVQTRMDDWSTQWLEYHSLACKVRQADDDEALFLSRNACLDGVLQPFTTFVDDALDGGVSAQSLQGSQRILTGLWKPADCRSADLLDYAVPSQHPAKASVDRAWLLLLAGDAEAARAMAAEAARRLPENEDAVALVRAKLIAGLAAAQAQSPEAPALLHEAAATAAASQLRWAQAEAWIALGRYDTPAGRPVALAHAQSLVDAVNIDRLRAQLLVARGEHQRSLGRNREALAHYHQALALVPSQDIRALITRSDILAELGHLAILREEWTTASRYLEEVVTLRESAFGPAHAELVHPLRGLGRAQAGSGEADAASRTLERALAIAQQAKSPALEIAQIQLALAALDAKRGQHTVAAGHYAAAVQSLDATSRDADLVLALEGLGTAWLSAGEPARATGAFERAVVLSSRVGWSPERRSTLYEALGRSLADADPDGALEAFREALALAPPADVPRLEDRIARFDGAPPSPP